MKKIMFYSFKGGTGRTTILANFAYELAYRGYKVGIVDLDIFSSGLSRIFDRIPLGIRYLQESLYDNDITLDDITIEINNYYNDITEGELLLIPSTNKLYDNQTNINIGRLFELVRRINDKFEHNRFDYLFYDSPSGFSNIPIYLILRRIENIFLFYKPSIQNLSGTKYFLEWASTNLNPADRKIYLIVNGIAHNFDMRNIEALSNKMNDLSMHGFTDESSTFNFYEINALKKKEYLLREYDLPQIDLIQLENIYRWFLNLNLLEVD